MIEISLAMLCRRQAADTRLIRGRVHSIGQTRALTALRSRWRLAQTTQMNMSAISASHVIVHLFVQNASSMESTKATRYRLSKSLIPKLSSNLKVFSIILDIQLKNFRCKRPSWKTESVKFLNRTAA